MNDDELEVNPVDEAKQLSMQELLMQRGVQPQPETEAQPSQPQPSAQPQQPVQTETPQQPEEVPQYQKGLMAMPSERDPDMTHFQNAITDIVDPFGQMTAEDRRNASEAMMAPIMALPDFGMDLVGMLGAPGGYLDDKWDEATKFQNPHLQKARGALSVIIPSLIGFAGVNAGVQGARLTGLTKGLATIGGNAAVDTAIIGISDEGEEDNLMRTLADSFPNTWGPTGRIPIPEKWKTMEGMTPEQRRELNMWENGLFSIVGDVLGFAILAGKPVMKWFQPVNDQAKKFKANQILDSADNETYVSIAKIDEALAQNPSKAEIKVLKAEKDRLVKQLEDTGATDATENALNSHVEKNQLSREIQTEQIAARKLDESGGNIAYDPDVHIKAADESQYARQSIETANVQKNMLDVASNKAGHSAGDNAHLISDNMLHKGYRAGGSSRNAVMGVAAMAEEAGDWKGIMKGFRYTKAHMDEAAWQVYRDIILAGSVADTKKLFLNNEDFAKLVKGAAKSGSKIEAAKRTAVEQRAMAFALRDLVDKFLGRDIALSSARVMDTLGREVTTAAEAMLKHGEEAVDPTRNMTLILDKMEFLMQEYGLNKYISGWQLQNENWIKQIADSPNPTELIAKYTSDFEAGMTKKAMEARQYRQTLEEIQRVEPSLLKPFVEVFSLSNGDVATLAALHEWGRKKVTWKGLIKSPDKTELNFMMKGMKAVRFNNVLSGLAALNALKGAAGQMIVKPMSAIASTGLQSILRMDLEPIRKTLYYYSGVYETNRRAMVDGWNMIKKVNHDPESMIKAFRKDYIIKDDKSWTSLDALAKVWEQQGNTGMLTQYNIAKNLHDMSKARWMRYGMTAMTGIDQYTNTMGKTYVSRYRALNEVYSKHGFTRPDLLKKAEKKHALAMVGADGTITDDALKAWSGEVALNLDDEIATNINKFTTEFPIATGLFMFPRTGMNWVKNASSYIPFTDKVIPGIGKYNKILSAGDDPKLISEALGLHGINMDTTPDAMLIYKMLQEEYRARHIWSSMLVGSLWGYAVTGNVRGNGSYNHSQRKKERDQFNYEPKTIRVPGTNKWVSFKGIPGVDPILSILGDMGYYMNDISQPALEDWHRKLAWTVSATFLNETPLAGLEPLVALGNGDMTWFSRYVANEARSYIPLSGAQGVIANGIDSAQKDIHDDIRKYIQNRIPIAKSFLPNHIDIWTGKPLNDINNPLLKGLNALNPFKVSDGGEPWRIWLHETGWSGTNLLRRDSTGNYEYSAEERELINTYIGDQQLWKQVEKLMKNPRWQKELAAIRKLRWSGKSYTRVQIEESKLPLYQVLNKIVRNGLKKAEARMQQENPAIYASMQNQRRINDALRKGKVNEAVEMADKDESQFKKIEGVLQYNSPNK